MKLKNIAINGKIQAKISLCSDIEKGELVRVVSKEDEYYLGNLTILVERDDGCTSWESHEDFRKPRVVVNNLKQIDQSVFDGLDEKWRFAAVDGEKGIITVFDSMPVLSTLYNYHTNRGDGNYEDLPELSGYDTSNWKDSLIERETAKELSGSDLTRKMLADGTDMVNCYVSDVSDYDALNDKDERTVMGFSDGWFHTNSVASWKYAVPAPKEKELTGSELCRAMLARGDKFVMCAVSMADDETALSAETVTLNRIVISLDKEWLYTDTGTRWHYAVPINNQGEPLTAAEAGIGESL